MDPKECLRLLLQAMSDGDAQAAQQFSADLTHWLNKGGFLPGRRDLSEICADFVLDRPYQLREDQLVRMGGPAVTPPVELPVQSRWPFKPAARPPGITIIPHNCREKGTC